MIMAMPSPIAYWIIQRLIDVADSGRTISGFVTARIANVDDESRSRWQLDIDMIYRCLVCDLITIVGSTEYDGLAEFIHTLRLVSPFVDLGGGFWNGNFADPTDKLIALCKPWFAQFETDKAAADAALIAAIEVQFDKHQVPWSDSP